MVAANIATVQILIVDNNELARVSLALELNQYANLEVVGAADGESAVTLTEQFQPDVVLMDLRMPVMDGLTASKHIKQRYPGVCIVAYTSVDDPQAEVMAQTAPIDQFCYKDIKAKALVDLIYQVTGRCQSRANDHPGEQNDEGN